MQDPVPLVLARDPFELAQVQSLLAQAQIVHNLFVPGGNAQGLFGPAVSAPATVCVARADLERARAVLAEAWGAPPDAPDV